MLIDYVNLLHKLSKLYTLRIGHYDYVNTDIKNIVPIISPYVLIMCCVTCGGGIVAKKQF